VKSRKEIAITKRDGTVEKFDVMKLTNCLARVLRGRAYDPRLAGPLARAVALHLREWTGSRHPTTQYIFRCVASVLEQTGLGDVAEDLHQHRKLRAVRRRRTRVLEDAERPARGSHGWQKGAIVAALERNYGVRHTVARFLAGQIEMQIFALNYRVITRPFLAELVRNEILAWGLADQQVLTATASAVAAPVARPGGKES
jgi:hypothetical protein